MSNIEKQKELKSLLETLELKNLDFSPSSFVFLSWARKVFFNLQFLPFIGAKNEGGDFSTVPKSNPPSHH